MQPAGALMIKGQQALRRVQNKVRPPAALFRLLHQGDEQFVCPICDYEGPFAGFKNFGGQRKHAICPRCGSYERHRLQYLVLRDVVGLLDGKNIRMLHFAPEDSFRQIFSKHIKGYETADLFMAGVDHKVDIRALPFPDGSYDMVLASHVLEHIREDVTAISEIRRILRPGGIAVLPVPIVTEKSIEYPEPNPFESFHMRAPGPDYYDKYREYFSRVDLYGSDSFPPQYQVYVYEDRTVWPTAECPLRPPMKGERHIDLVPVCYA